MTDSDRESRSNPAPVEDFDRTERLLFWALMIFLGSQGLFFIQAPDFGLHLVTGGYTIHNGLPSVNVFSPINGEHPMAQHEWAFQVISYGIAALTGTPGIVWARLVLVLAIGLLLHRTLRPGRGYAIAIVYLALGLFVAHTRFVWRPELFSMLLLAAALKLLIDFIEDRRDRLLILPLIFAIWANVHGYFLAGLIVVGCFAIGELGESLLHGKDIARAKRLIAIGALCAVATLLNPYHYEGSLYPFQLLIDLFTVDSHFSTSIPELMSPHKFQNLWAVKAWYPLLFLFGIACATQGRKVRFAYVLTALAIWVMARSTYRNIGLYGMTLGVLAAVQWQTVQPWRAWTRPSVRISHACAFAIAAILLGMAAFIGTNRLYVIEGSQRQFGVGVGADVDQPARAFIDEFIPPEYQVFNSFGNGSSFLWWFYPERRPFIDGNGDGYPPEFFAEHWRIINGTEPFDSFASRHEINWVYLKLNMPLAAQLYRHPAWHPVFLDSNAIILVDQAPEFSSLRHRFNLSADLAEGRVPDWEPTPLPTFLNHTAPRSERILILFLERVGERNAARTVRQHSARFLPRNRRQGK